jgi:uncharacterized membrane protein YhaH (DUF805 family)
MADFNLGRFLFLPVGRVNRMTYLGYVIITVIMGRVLAALHISAMSQAYTLTMLYPSACVIIKRLHDIGIRGAFIALPLVLPVLVVAYLLIAVYTSQSGGTDADLRGIAFGGPIVVGLALLIGVGAFQLFLLVVPGQAGSNRFGEVPTSPARTTT